jgi:hypothetical protein
MHAGASVRQVDDTLDALEGGVDAEALRSARMLWARVKK